MAPYTGLEPVVSTVTRSRGLLLLQCSMVRPPRLELGVVLIKSQVPYPLGVRRRKVGREGFEPPKHRRLVYSELTSPMVAPTQNGRMAPPELLHAIYSIVNVQARLSQWLTSVWKRLTW
jgi:hypothetical protein